MADMRQWMQLFETVSKRLWLGPHGEVIDCVVVGMSHSKYIMEHPQVFGLDAAALTRLTEFWDAQEEEFDYDYVIALGEQAGWVRTSEDGADAGSISVSGGSVRHVHRAMLWLSEHGYLSGTVLLELDQIAGATIHMRYFYLDAEAMARFLQSRKLPIASDANSLPVSLPPIVTK